MGPGPVFRAEMRSASRRARPFALRCLYVGALLAAVWLAYLGRWDGLRRVGPAGLAAFARDLFSTIAFAQGAAILAITPALVAGSIAGDRARGTLDQWLVTRMSAGQIVLGRLVPRLVQLGQFLALGLPVLVVLSLLGGIDPIGEILPVEAATAAGAVFLAGVSIFASSVAREPREAIFAAYGLGALWLAVPPLLDSVAPSAWGGLRDWVAPLVDAWSLANPVIRARPAPGSLWGATAGLTLAGAGFTLAAIALLRPVGRALADRSGRPTRRARARRRPACGDDPMRWKEVHVRGRPGVLGLVVRAVVALVVIGLAIEAARQAAGVVAEAGRVAWRPGPRADLNVHLRLAGTIVYGLALLGVATSAAASIPSERERGTWAGLAASPLEGPEILSAQRAGAYRRVRPLVLTLGALVLTGVLTGALHPLAPVLIVVEVPFYLAFAAALGGAISLHARTTLGAVGATVAALVFCQGGYLLCCAAMPNDASGRMVFGCTPAMVAVSLVSPEDVAGLASGGLRAKLGAEAGIAIVLSIVASGVGAMVLNILAETTFDAAQDRPRRDLTARPR